MARHFYSRRLHCLTLWLCVVVAVVPPGFVRAGGGLAAIDAFHVGRYHLTCGDRNKALDAFNDALKLNPQFVQAYIARGKLLAEMGEYQSALADLNFALRLQPMHAEGFAYRGFVLLSLGKPEESLHEFDMALRLDPSYARVHYLRGQAHRAAGNEMAAESSIAAALKLDPSIETLQTLAASSNDDGTIGVRMNAPAGLERTSQMADTSVAPPPQLPRELQGRVVRFDQHPQLAKLNVPFGPAPAARQQPSQAPLTARKPSPLPPPHPKTESEAGGVKTVQQPTPNKLTSVPADSNAATLANLPMIAPPPSLEASPATVVAGSEVELVPSAAAILSGNASGETLPPKPSPEASQANIAASVASTQQSVTEPSPALVSDDDATAKTATPVADNAEPKSSPLPAVETSPAVALIADEPTKPESKPAVPAEAAFEQACRDAELCRLRGVEREEQGDPSAAFREYDNAIRLDPTNPQSYCLRGRLYLKAQLATEASADFERAIQLAPGLAIGYYGRGHARYLQHDFANAIDDYTIVIRLDDCHALALIERGHCLAQLGEAEKGEVDRKAAILLDPSLAKTGPKYGGAIPKAPVPSDVLMPTESTAAYVSDDPAKIEQTTGSEPAGASAFGDLFAPAEPAKPSQDSAKQPQAPAQPLTLPTDVSVTASTDGVATASDRVNPVLISDEAAAPKLPEPSNGPQRKTELQPTAAEPADLLPTPPSEPAPEENAAKQELQRLTGELSRAPGDAKLYFRRAEVQLKLNRADSAVDDLNAALRIEPSFVEALTLRAKAHEAAQRLPAAVADLNELLQLKPNDGALLAQRGGAKLMLGLVEEAAADLTQAFAKGHDSAEAYCRRGLAFAVAGNAQQAMDDFAAALEREPGNAEIYVCRGRAFAEFNRPAEALADFNRAVELNPKCADAYFERSRLYALRGAYEKSQSDRRTALSLDPTLR